MGRAPRRPVPGPPVGPSPILSLLALSEGVEGELPVAHPIDGDAVGATARRLVACTVRHGGERPGEQRRSGYSRRGPRRGRG